MSDSEVAYPTADSGCSYKGGCERPPWWEGKCLYHSPSNGDSAETARLVWQTAREMAADKDAEECDFGGWHFPDDPDGEWGGEDPVGWFVGCTFERSVSFDDATFGEDAWFNGATFSVDARFNRATFSGNARFKGAKFSGDASFEEATFSSDTAFDGATFSGNALFMSATFTVDAWFEKALFSGVHTSFDGATVGRFAWFADATFSGLACFEGATVDGTTWFANATFSDHTWFEKTMFSGDAEFGGATFSGDAWFGGATFRGDAGFGCAKFNEKTFFLDAAFGGKTRFLSARFAGYASFDGARFHPGVDILFDKPRRGRPFRRRRAGETAYRLAKQAAQERGDYAAAGDYHYAEQCAIEDKYRRMFGRDALGNRPRRKAFWGWCISIGRFFFGRMVYGYGERPMHPLFIALAVIVLWAGFYWLGGAIVPSDPGLEPAARAAYEPDFGECFYCSIVTFTTLGYGDYQPKEPYRLLAASEALLGAALMAVFIVCLSKKYIR